MFEALWDAYLERHLYEYILLTYDLSYTQISATAKSKSDCWSAPSCSMVLSQLLQSNINDTNTLSTENYV